MVAITIIKSVLATVMAACTIMACIIMSINISTQYIPGIDQQKVKSCSNDIGIKSILLIGMFIGTLGSAYIPEPKNKWIVIFLSCCILSSCTASYLGLESENETSGYFFKLPFAEEIVESTIGKNKDKDKDSEENEE